MAKTLYCSFCFASQHEVRKLLSGFGGIYICDECVGVCQQIIADGPPPPRLIALDDVPTERLLQRLSPIEQTLQGKGSQLQSVVDVLRKREVSWAQIGDALGVSRQSAWERFS